MFPTKPAFEALLTDRGGPLEREGEFLGYWPHSHEVSRSVTKCHELAAQEETTDGKWSTPTTGTSVCGECREWSRARQTHPTCLNSHCHVDPLGELFHSGVGLLRERGGGKASIVACTTAAEWGYVGHQQPSQGRKAHGRAERTEIVAAPKCVRGWLVATRVFEAVERLAACSS